MNKQLLNQAALRFEEFRHHLNMNATENLAPYSEAISATLLHHHIASGNVTQADQILDTLSPNALYDEELIQPVYAFFLSRDRHERAYAYLIDAKAYLDKMGIDIPEAVQYLVDNAQTDLLIDGIKRSFASLLTLHPKDVPKITPDLINNKRTLREFILQELVGAGKVMKGKIQGLAQIKHENRWNDLVQAVLQLRFPLWGWNINDQSRLGSSATGKDAGEVDLLIRAGGHDVALVEALILKGSDFQNTQKHLLKCFSYSGNLQQFYILIYYNGKRDKFDSTWSSYCKNVAKVPFEERHAYNATLGFKDLAEEFNDARDFKIARTAHNSGVEIFHIMMDLSTVKPAKRARKKGSKEARKKKPLKPGKKVTKKPTKRPVKKPGK
jgi:hypothetical protein